MPAPSAGELEARATRRLLFYARPESHAARNMFELGVLALSQVLQDGVFADGWELNGVGAVGRGSSISLGDGYALRLRPRLDQRAYAELLREHDVGLALMYTPHPSLVPIEMASAGMVTVTNTFENKTADAMAAISANLHAVRPSVDSIAAGLRERGGAQRRLRGPRRRQPRALEHQLGRLVRRRLWWTGSAAPCGPGERAPPTRRRRRNRPDWARSVDPRIELAEVGDRALERRRVVVQRHARERHPGIGVLWFGCGHRLQQRDRARAAG